MDQAIIAIIGPLAALGGACIGYALGLMQWKWKAEYLADRVGLLTMEIDRLWLMLSDYEDKDRARLAQIRAAAKKGHAAQSAKAAARRATKQTTHA